MKFNTVDLHQELRKVKAKQGIVEEANELLKNDREKSISINKRVRDGSKNTSISHELALTDNIYTLSQIREICISYRLRFLDAKRFKGEIPLEAFSKIKELEKETGKVFSSFKIIAPKKLFELDDKDSDPLLFVQLSDQKYYFIHKWGGEVNRFRSALAYPFRSFMHMFVFLAILAFCFSSVIPTSSSIVFAFLFVHSFIAMCGIACLIIFSMRENFSDIEWNSKFLA